MIKILLLGIFVCIVLLAAQILQVDLPTVGKTLGSILHENELSFVESWATRNQHREKVTRKEIRVKSKLYKFYKFLNELILNLGFDKFGISVETFFCFLIFIMLAVSLIIALLSENISFSLFSGVVVGLLSLLGFYTYGAANGRHRQAVIRSSINILSAAISFGFVKAVRLNYKQFDESIQKNYMDFLDNIDKNGFNFPRALFRLSLSFGDCYSEFADLVLVYTEDYHQGIEQEFQHLILQNGRISTIMRKCDAQFSADNLDYLAATFLVVAFGIITIATSSRARAFYSGTLGEFVILFYIVVIGLGMAGVQKLHSAHFK